MRSGTPSSPWDSFSASAVSPSASAGPELTRHRTWSCAGPNSQSRFGTTSRCSGPAPWPSVASSRRRGGRALTRILDLVQDAAVSGTSMTRLPERAGYPAATVGIKSGRLKHTTARVRPRLRVLPVDPGTRMKD